MLDPLLEVYFKYSLKKQQDIFLVRSGCALMIEMTSENDARSTQTRLEHVIVDLARFCNLYEIGEKHFFRVRNEGSAEHYYKPYLSLKKAMQVYAVSKILNEVMSDQFALEYAARIVEILLERPGGRTPKHDLTISSP